MVEREFVRLLKEYPESFGERRRFIGLVNDFLCKEPLQANLVLTLYKMGIHNDIQKASQLTNAFAHRFVQRLMNEHGVSDDNAIMAVILWCGCYGKCILKIPFDIAGADDLFDFDSFVVADAPSLTPSEIARLVVQNSERESLIQIVEESDGQRPENVNVLLFFTKLVFDNFFDKEILEQIFLSAKRNEIDDFFEAVKIVYPYCEEGKAVYYGILAVKVKSKFNLIGINT